MPKFKAGQLVTMGGGLYTVFAYHAFDNNYELVRGDASKRLKAPSQGDVFVHATLVSAHPYRCSGCGTHDHAEDERCPKAPEPADYHDDSFGDYETKDFA